MKNNTKGNTYEKKESEERDTEKDEKHFPSQLRPDITDPHLKTFTILKKLD
jgi:hypothetical protein